MNRKENVVSEIVDEAVNRLEKRFPILKAIGYATAGAIIGIFLSGLI